MMRYSCLDSKVIFSLNISKKCNTRLDATRSGICQDFTFFLNNILLEFESGAKLGGLGQNGHPRGRNFALNETQGEVGVSLKKFFFWVGGGNFILSPDKCKIR